MQRTPLVNNQSDRRENRLGKRPVSTTLAPTVPALTPAQMYSNFEEWIKMCTDNVSPSKTVLECTKCYEIESKCDKHMEFCIDRLLS